MIGRRFRLAHILFANGKVVEVATFRRRPDPAADGAGRPTLLQTSDNTFGTPREDALRRDFTINGLFYDISDFSIIDYVGGLDDLEAGLIRTIGDPDVRFQEDPVRMMRAVEFASRLGFAITPDAYEAILRHRKEIVKSAPPRVTEELAQALRGGHALPTLLLMREVGPARRAPAGARRRCSAQIDPDPTMPAERATSSGRCSTCSTPSGGAGASSTTPSSSRCSSFRSCGPRVRDVSPGRRAGRRTASRPSSRTSVAPLAFRMSLPRASTDRIKQALADASESCRTGRTRRSRTPPAGLRDAFAHRARHLRADRDGDRARAGPRPRLARRSRRGSRALARPARSRCLRRLPRGAAGGAGGRGRGRRDAVTSTHV